MEKFLLKLKKLGLKQTAPRKQILAALLKSDRPQTINEIMSSCNSVDFATVFRTVKLFMSNGFLQATNFNDKQIRYSLIKENSHPHHILCRDCGKIEQLDVCIIDKVRKLTDYKIIDHSMEFVGICPECNK
jgi:Fe2+ or Zn2+ uptake regulation protein